MSNIPALKIGDLVAKVPIIQGGMGVGISLSSLAGAVAKEGAIGVISAAEIGMIEEKDFFQHPQEANKRALRKEIRKAKDISGGGIIGINIMIAMSEFEELCIVAAQEKADIIFAGAGLPLTVPIDEIRKNNTKFGVIVSSARATELIFRYWDRHYKDMPDCVVVEGPKAGGHLGFRYEEIFDPNFALEKITPPVIDVVKKYEEKYSKKIPVVAAGGIYSGEDIYFFMNEVGVDGVQMGTRFVATHECDADIKFKEAYIKAKKEDVVIIKSPVGLPGRAINNKFLEDVKKGKKQPFKCIWQCLKGCDYKKAPYCITQALVNAQKGKFAGGFAFAGENVYRVDKIVSVKELIDELVEGYLKAKDNSQ